MRWPPEDLERYLALQLGVDQRTGERLELQRRAVASKGLVAGTSEPLAVHAGLEVLRQGGRAADAALTTALTQVALAAGAAISYAGILTATYYDAASGEVHTLNAGYNTVRAEQDPLTIPPLGEPSGRSVLVPGFMAGVEALHERFGTVPFAQLFEPAIWVAERGVPLSPMAGSFLAAHEQFITRLPETRRIFATENGRLYRPGELFRQPDLAETLKRVAREGAAYMYTGPWAARFVDAVRREGGVVALEDLSAYRVSWSEPIQMPYRDYTVATLGPPNSGGTQTLASLKLAEVAGVSQRGQYAASPDALYDLIQISRIQSVLANVPPAVAQALFPGIDPSPAARLTTRTAERLWGYLQEPDWWNRALSRARRSTPGHSAGIVVVDELGNVASIVHSCNCLGWGSTAIFVDGVSIPDSAAHQQAAIARTGPGGRLPDGTNPLIVMQAGAPVLASAAVGSALQEATLQNLINVLDFRMEPKAAVDQPNTRGPFHGVDVTGVQNPEYEKETVGEGEFPDAVLEGVRARGQPIRLVRGDQQRGYWIGIWIDPVTRTRTGGVPSALPALVEGY